MAHITFNSTSATNLPIGSRLITIGATPFRALSWDAGRTMRKISRTNIFGDEAEYQMREDPNSFPLTVQKPASNTAKPEIGTTFTVDSVLYVIASAAVAEPMGEFGSFTFTVETAGAVGAGVSGG
jgi:hypothetical protein